MAFSPLDERMLITLTNVASTPESTQTVYLWQWDKQKCLSHQILQHGMANQMGTQISFSSIDKNVVLVTGNNVYRYFKIGDNQQLKSIPQSTQKRDAQISPNYTCHCWLKEGKFLIGTDQGEIMLFESNGDYKMLLQESPGESFYIETMRTCGTGFIIAGDKGQIMIFDKTDKQQSPFHSVATHPSQAIAGQNTEALQKILTNIRSSRIKSLTLSKNEDMLVFSTSERQIIKMSISVDRPNDDVTYEYLVYPFHSRAIEGMDVCVKKQLVATCSSDRTVKIWSYTMGVNGEFKLEINQVFENDEAKSLAFHPSGFHLVVGFTDKIKMLNIF